MTDYDFVIIGAGAAGIGAGFKLSGSGHSFVILEAADRVGGRAYTDTQSMPIPWDHGCHWLHCANVNPLVPWADRLGAQYYKQHGDYEVGYWLGDSWANAAERQEAYDAIERGFGAVYKAAEAGKDVAVSDILPDLGQNALAFRHLFQLMSSGDPEQVSCAGYADYEDTDADWPMISGYGDLITRMAQDQPIRLGVPVTHVTEDAGGFVVATPGGNVRAKAVIVTVSNNVLLNEGLVIESAAARPVLDAMPSMPCGSYEKVAIELNAPLEGIGDARFINIAPSDEKPLNLQILKWSDKVVIAHLGGEVARSALGAGMCDYAKARLCAAFGSDTAGDIASMAPTGWQTNPLTLGAYSTALPGRAQERRDAIAAHTGRIGFAGEAYALTWQATAHGAYQSGQDVAARILAQEFS